MRATPTTTTPPTPRLGIALATLAGPTLMIAINTVALRCAINLFYDPDAWITGGARLLPTAITAAVLTAVVGGIIAAVTSRR